MVSVRLFVCADLSCEDLTFDMVKNKDDNMDRYFTIILLKYSVLSVSILRKGLTL